MKIPEEADPAHGDETGKVESSANSSPARLDGGQHDGHDRQSPVFGHDGFWSRRRWLARLSTSFLIVSAYLAYTGYTGARTHQISTGMSGLYLLAALLAFVLFLLGTRQRHRPSDEDTKL